MTPRLPRRVYLGDRWVQIVRVGLEELRDIAADHHDEQLGGCWRGDQETIYILKTQRPARQHWALAHEMQHALTDILDRR